MSNLSEVQVYYLREFWQYLETCIDHRIQYQEFMFHLIGVRDEFSTHCVTGLICQEIGKKNDFYRAKTLSKCV